MQEKQPHQIACQKIIDFKDSKLLKNLTDEVLVYLLGKYKLGKAYLHMKTMELVESRREFLHGEILTFALVELIPKQYEDFYDDLVKLTKSKKK